MSDAQVDALLGRIGENVLEHHGVKGMKWGVRRDNGHEGEKATTKKIAKLDKTFDKAAGSPRATFAVYNNAAVDYNNESVDRINNKPKYKNVDYFDDKSKLTQEYQAEHAKAFENHLKKAAKDFGTNASGTKELSVKINDDGSWDLEVKEIKHDNFEPGSKIRLIVKRDASGKIVSINLPKDALEHLEEDEDDTRLLHYGVKGMRWGKRKSDSSSRESKPKVPTSADHDESRALLSKSARSLSNAEIKKINERLQLEKTLGELNMSQGTYKKTQRKVKDVLEVGQTMQQAYNLVNGPLGKAVVSAIKVAT